MNSNMQIFNSKFQKIILRIFPNSKIFHYYRIIDDEQFQQSVPYNGFGWNRYHDLNGIYSWIDGLAQQYPNILSIQNYGKSYEGRPLRAVKISKGKV